MSQLIHQNVAKVWCARRHQTEQQTSIDKSEQILFSTQNGAIRPPIKRQRQCNAKRKKVNVPHRLCNWSVNGCLRPAVNRTMHTTISEEKHVIFENIVRAITEKHIDDKTTALPTTVQILKNRISPPNDKSRELMWQCDWREHQDKQSEISYHISTRLSHRCPQSVPPIE